MPQIQSNQIATNLEFTFQELALGNGTATNPSLSFSSEPGLGWYRGGATRMSLAFGTVEAAFFDGTTSVFGLKNNYNMQTNVGTAALPGYSFNGDPDTGLYTDASNVMNVATGGTGRWRFNNNGFIPLDSAQIIFVNDGTAGAPSLAFNADTDTGIFRSGSDVFQLVAGGNINIGILSTGAQVATRDGSAGSPSLTFFSDQNTGIYRVSADVIGFSTGGNNPMTITSGGPTITNGFDLLAGGGTCRILMSDATAPSPSYTFSNDTDTGIYRPGANQVSISTNGVERFRVHDTFVPGKVIQWAFHSTSTQTSTTGSSFVNTGLLISSFVKRRADSLLYIVVEAFVSSNQASSSGSGMEVMLRDETNSVDITNWDRVHLQNSGSGTQTGSNICLTAQLIGTTFNDLVARNLRIQMRQKYHVGSTTSFNSDGTNGGGAKFHIFEYIPNSSF